MKTNYYKVAEHIFSISMPKCCPLWEHHYAYEPFLISEKEITPNAKLFDFTLCNEVDQSDKELIVSAEDHKEIGFPGVSVFKTKDGYLYELYSPLNHSLSAVLRVNQSTHEAQMAFCKTDGTSLLIAFNNSLILCYMTMSVMLSTLFFHSSTVVLEGKAYMFLGKSGTGKSTHSRMWLENFSESYLLNDDHPIVRIMEDGEVRTFGSPWSGKTNCYKALSAPTGAIVRIEQAPENQISKLRGVMAFASITSSTSGMQWDKAMVDARMATLDKLITEVGCYRLKCLPNHDAAQLCMETLTK